MDDEKHCDWQGKRVYLAVTAAAGCVFGSSLSPSAGYEDLKVAYGVFKQEVTDCAPRYAPKTVTSDGWDATRSAWEALFPGIVWILCFLHEVIKIRDWCRSKADLRHTLLDKLWNIYHATSKRLFAQRIQRFIEWAKTASLPQAIDARVQRLRNKSPFFQRAYDCPDAYRTTNQADRPMNYLARALYAMQDFHGSWEAAELAVRSMALLWNFHPFCRKTRQLNGGCLCPFEKLNGFRYHDDWMRNLLIASSLNRRRPLPTSTHTK